MKNVLKNAYIPLLSICLYFSPSPLYSQPSTDSKNNNTNNNSTNNPYSPLENKAEFTRTAKAFKQHKIQEGEFKGLENHLVSKTNISEYADFITTNSPYLNELKKEIPADESNLKKAELIYNALKQKMQYARNDFGKMANVKKENLPIQDQKILETIVTPITDKYVVGMQTVDETFKYQKGDCDELTVQLVSALQSVGIESYLTFVQTKDNKNHLIAYFDSGFKRKEFPNADPKNPFQNRKEIFAHIDPSYYQEFSFEENMKQCLQYTNTNNYPVRTIIQK